MALCAEQVQAIAQPQRLAVQALSVAQLQAELAIGADLPAELVVLLFRVKQPPLAVATIDQPALGLLAIGQYRQPLRRAMAAPAVGAVPRRRPARIAGGAVLTAAAWLACRQVAARAQASCRRSGAGGIQRRLPRSISAVSSQPAQTRRC